MERAGDGAQRVAEAEQRVGRKVAQVRVERDGGEDGRADKGKVEVADDGDVLAEAVWRRVGDEQGERRHVRLPLELRERTREREQDIKNIVRWRAPFLFVSLSRTPDDAATTLMIRRQRWSAVADSSGAVGEAGEAMCVAGDCRRSDHGCYKHACESPDLCDLLASLLLAFNSCHAPNSLSRPTARRHARNERPEARGI